MEDTDKYGYIWKWEQVSSAYRQKKKYTCERCGFKAEGISARRYIEVHHKDGNKLHNSEDNFECLCVACHANVDERHKMNFSKGASRIRLDTFLKEYKTPQISNIKEEDLPF